RSRLRPGDRKCRPAKGIAELPAGNCTISSAPGSEIHERGLHGSWADGKAAYFGDADCVYWEADKLEEQFFLGADPEAGIDYGVAPRPIEELRKQVQQGIII